MKKVPLNAPFFAKDLRDCSLPETFDSDGVQVSSGLDSRGFEVPDPTPMAPPVGYSSGPSLADFVHRMIRQEFAKSAALTDMETFEEADDFDVEDDPLDPLTPYEKVFDKEIPQDWPMYYNPETGFHGQLPPDAKPPEGFVALRRQRSVPEGWELPEPPRRQREGTGSDGRTSAGTPASAASSASGTRRDPGSTPSSEQFLNDGTRSSE